MSSRGEIDAAHELAGALRRAKTYIGRLGKLGPPEGCDDPRGIYEEAEQALARWDDYCTISVTLAFRTCPACPRHAGEVYEVAPREDATWARCRAGHLLRLGERGWELVGVGLEIPR